MFCRTVRVLSHLASWRFTTRLQRFIAQSRVYRDMEEDTGARWGRDREGGRRKIGEGLSEEGSEEGGKGGGRERRDGNGK